jgi:hypothetical protein
LSTPNDRAATRARVAAGLALMMGTGCASRTPLESVEVVLQPPSGWTPVSPDRYLVPGETLAAWSGPSDSSLVVFRTLANPEGTAETLREEIVNRWSNLPEWTIASSGVETLGGAPVARIDVVAPGLGDALVPTGQGRPVAPEGREAIPTRRVALAFVRPADTIQVYWHCPESAWPELQPQWGDCLKSLRVGMPAGLTSTY